MRYIYLLFVFLIGMTLVIGEDTPDPIINKIQELDHADMSVKMAAVEYLAKSPDSRAIEILLQLLSNPSLDTHEIAVKILLSLQGGYVIPTIFKQFQTTLEKKGTTDPKLICNYINITGQLKILSAIPYLRLFTKDAHHGIRQVTVFALGNFPPEICRPILLECLLDHSAGIRGTSLYVLGRIEKNRRKIEPAIVALLNDKSVSLQLVRTIYEIRAPETPQYLIEIIQNPDIDEMPKISAISFLEELLSLPQYIKILQEGLHISGHENNVYAIKYKHLRKKVLQKLQKYLPAKEYAKIKERYESFEIEHKR